LLPTAAQTGIELSLSNLLVLGALLTVLFGETAFAVLQAQSQRWAEAAWAFCKPLAGWKWVPSIAQRLPMRPTRLRHTAEILWRVVLPVMVIGGAFALLLGSGNAIVGRWMADAFTTIIRWLTELDLSLGRVLLWLFLATFALTLLRPQTLPATPRLWARTIPDFPQPANLSLARWRTVALLGVLNALFFAANTADALYLWANAALPAGVSHSRFVHHGVYNLIAAVILSAFMLVLLFQQTPEIRNAPVTKVLALAWIAQNVVLITGVLLRLLRYVEAYQLSELRVYVGCFLLLVTLGFGLLTLHVVTHRGLGWLLVMNLGATFALFFVLQFLDVAKFVAETNVGHWEKDNRRTLDVDYLASLGTSAVPSLIKVAETPGRSEAHAAFAVLQCRKPDARAWLAQLNWRSWQHRKVGHTRLLAEHEVRTRR